MQHPKRILVCPLDWGLGHAARCIPIIRELKNYNTEIYIAGSGRSLELLKQEFPEIRCTTLTGYDISYPAGGNMIFKILASIPRILKAIKKEHMELSRIINEFKIDTVISDNRYGCWNKSTRNIFITHQLMVKAPAGERILHKIVLSHIKNFDECWIPDHEGQTNLSGDLSHKYRLPENVFFVGPLSRFNSESILSPPIRYDIMAIISGPEPQRTIFEKLITEELKATNLQALIVSGKPEEKTDYSTINNITIVSHLPSDEMENAILSSSLIVSRSGYSTVMDLSVLKKKAIFIPTPGQTEQEYLASEMMRNKIAFMQKQSDIDLQEAINESINYSGFQSGNEEMFKNRIHLMLCAK